MAGMELPVRAIREQVASAVDLICQQSRMRDGSRKVVAITEVQGMEGEMVTMSDIFEFEQTGIESGKIIGRVRPRAFVPSSTTAWKTPVSMSPPRFTGLDAAK